MHVGGADIATLSEEEAAELRNRRIGFVFQFHHLLRDFTALENVMMPALIRGDGTAVARTRATKLLDQVGLGGRLSHKPRKLSGESSRGLRSRVLSSTTLSWSSRTSRQVTWTRPPAEDVQDILFEMKERHGVALVVVTHNRELAGKAEKVLRLREGVLENV